MFFSAAVRAGGMLMLHWLLILRFDGSVRCPSDRAYSSDALVARAACAAALLDDDEGLLMVGGKRLGLNMHSMDAEYEGLIFGLEEVIRHSSRDDENRSPARILIQGDCRTVLQHVDGRAKPRRLQDYSDRARALVAALPGRVALEHIPRERNALCDAVAGAMVGEAEREAYVAAWASLSEVGARLRRNVDPAGGDAIGAFWRRHSTSVPHSHRTIFYRRMAATAALARDFEALAWVGRAMGTDVAAMRTPEATADGSAREDLVVEALAMQLYGLSAAGGRQKATDALRHKHRYVLRSRSRRLDDTWARLESPDEWLAMGSAWTVGSSLDENRRSSDSGPAEDREYRENIRRSVVAACQSDSFARNASLWVDARTFTAYRTEPIAT